LDIKELRYMGNGGYYISRNSWIKIKETVMEKTCNFGVGDKTCILNFS